MFTFMMRRARQFGVLSLIGFSFSFAPFAFGQDIRVSEETVQRERTLTYIDLDLKCQARRNDAESRVSKLTSDLEKAKANLGRAKTADAKDAAASAISDAEVDLKVAKQALVIEEKRYLECQKEAKAESQKRLDAIVQDAANRKKKLDEDDRRANEKPCEDLKTKFNEAKSTLMSSCATTGLDSCLNIALQCTTCKGDKAPSYCPGKKEAREARKKTREEALRGEAGAKKRNSSEISEILSCPQVAIKRVGELEKQLEKHMTEKDKLEDEINETNEKLQASLSKIQVAELELQEKIEELGADREKKEKKFRNDTKEELKDKRKQFDGLNGEITKITQEIQKLNLARIEGISTAERSCHEKALGALEVYLKERREGLKASQVGTDSLDSLFSSYGKNRKEKNEDYAKRHYDSCVRDRMHLDKIDSIKRSHALALQQLTDQVSSIRKLQAQLIQEMGSDETQKQFKEQIEGIYKESKAQVDKEVKKFQALSTKENSNTEKLKTKLQLLQRRLATTQSDMTHKEAVYGAADEVADGREKDDPGSKLVVNHGLAMGAAGALLTSSACKCISADKNKYGKFELNAKEPICKDAAEINCAGSKSEPCTVLVDSKGTAIKTLLMRENELGRSSRTAQ